MRLTDKNTRDRSSRAATPSKYLAVLLTGIGAASLFPNAALAQDAPAAGQGTNAIGEVVVTATRRSESSLDVPLSIAALDGDRLIDSQIKNIADLAAIVPGITFTSGRATGPTSSDITIRGIGTGGSGDVTTGIYLNETTIQGSKQEGGGFGETFPYVFDLERVEVLRGPQGTLFGAGAMGGALRYIQRQPDLHDFSGHAVGEVATTDNGGETYEAGVAMGGPIVDGTLGFRASAWRRHDGGYIDTVDPFTLQVVDEDSNRSDTDVVSLAVSYAPTPNITLTPSIFWQNTDVNSTSYNYFRYLSDEDNGDYRYGGLERQPYNDRFWVGAFTAEADLGFADLISISSYVNRHADGSTNVTPSFGAVAIYFGFPDGYGNPLGPSFPVSYADAAHLWFVHDRESFSQEVRLSSQDGPDSRISWTVGAYYSRLDETGLSAFATVPFNLFPAGIVTKKITTQEQLAAFGQVDFHITEDLTATVGGRVAQLKVHGASGGYVGLNYEDDEENTPFTPKVGLEYQLTPNNMLYASYSTGFRAGGVNEPLDFTCGGRVADPNFGPDELESYEIGSKNRLFDDRMTLSVSGYHTIWSDIQTFVAISQCNDGFVSNAGSAEINGFEAEISAAITEQFRVDFSAAYIDAQYTEDVTDGEPIVASGYAISNYSPWTLTAAAQYSFLLGGHDAYFRVEDTYHSEVEGPLLSQLPGSAAYNPDATPDPSWNMLNLRAGVNLGEFNVAFFMTNALNTHPVLALNNYSWGNNFFVARSLTPRTFGFNVNYNF